MSTFEPPLRNQSPYLPFGDQRDAPFYGKDILSVKQFTHDDLEYIFGVAREMREMVERVGSFDLLKGKILTNLFYEPSTRTRVSFEVAAKRLSADVIHIATETSSVKKGETLIDTGKNIQALKADIIVVRHNHSGAAAMLARHVDISVINAGDGWHEHPTQALLDIFTLKEKLALKLEKS